MHRIAFLICVVVIFISPLHGEEVRQYKVEMILFTHLDKDDRLSEKGLSEPQWLDLENAVEISLDIDEPNYQILPNADMDLIGIRSVLQRSARYKVLKHIAWHQPGLSHGAARPVHIQGGTDFSIQSQYRVPQSMSVDADKTVDGIHPILSLKQIDGTVKVVLGRYLHFYTDLIFLRPLVTQANERPADGQSAASIPFTYYRVKSHRRMRSGELHYLDHPLLGILVQITPLPIKD